MTSRRSNDAEAKPKILLSLLNRRAKIASQPLFGEIKDTSPSRGQVKPQGDSRSHKPTANKVFNNKVSCQRQKIAYTFTYFDIITYQM